MSDQKPPRFQYQDLTTPSISVAMWDKIAIAVFDPTTGLLGLIKSAILASFATLYVIVREKLVAAEMAVAKQKYDQSQDADTQNQVDAAVAGLNTSKGASP